MDTSLVAADNKDAFISQLSALIEERLSGKKAQQVKAFAVEYYDQFPIDELEGRKISDIYGAVYGWWNMINQRPAAPEPKVRVFNPSLDEDHWLCPHTVVAVVQSDMPFLVDSIRMELNRRGISVHTVYSSIHNVGRDEAMKLTEIVPRHEAAPKKKGVSFGKEALIYFEINLHTDAEEMAEIVASLRDILLDVDVVVRDYKPMLAAVGQVSKNLAKVPDSEHVVDLAESCEFVRWLADGHFTFMAYSEYEFFDQDGTRALREVTDKRLGLFHRHSKDTGAVVIDDFNAGMARFHLTPKVLAFSKSSVRSRVHRHAYSDYVVVKRYDKNGKVDGECRFMGLYTSPVYTLSPTKIPLIRKKIEQVIERADLDPQSHDCKALKQTLETFPRDELFQSSGSELFETSVGVMRINERYRVKLFMRRDPYGKFVNALLYVPRDIFSTAIRLKIQELISKSINAKECEFTTYFSESILARVHLVFRVDPSKPIEYDVRKLQEKIIDITRTWEDHLHAALVENHGEEKGARLFKSYQHAFSSAYREHFDARAAVFDIETMGNIIGPDALGMSFYQPVGVEKNSFRFKVFQRNTTLELSDGIPVLERMGMRVIGEHPYRIDVGEDRYWMHDFELVYDLPADIDVHSARHLFQEAFAAVWGGRTENDSFNQLVLGASLEWREVAILRIYARYMKQTTFNFSQTYIANTLANHMAITRNLVAMFKAKFDPAENDGSETAVSRIKQLETEILTSLDNVDNLNEDRIIRRYLDMLNGSLRTNFFQKGSDGEHKDYISIKFSPRSIPEIPEPRPLFEIFVYSPRVEGVHLRGGAVARGGLRWSDRLQDYRTEVLGLVKAQQVKNAVIVPNGAKGGFVSKQRPKGGDREAIQKEGIECYKIFIRGLLDVTDNLIDGAVVPPKSVVRHDSDDPYLVVAADKGTATFSDIANGISKEYNHWLGDAFASGGSQGYDHKGMGITARGAWVGVKRHFMEKGLNTQTTDFTVIGIGDMAGDVFGNGMLMSEHICLVAGFNHLHIFIDPTPDSAKSFKERKRLFELPRSSWTDYNQKLISKGGGIFERSAKSIPISPEMKKAFAIKEDKLTPTDLISALLKAPVDLIWNGGIGTYVKSTQESHAQVGDKANDALRVNGRDLRCKVFGEGGNLGMTQLGRIEFSLAGGACNTDFIDNAAGVDCSDHEVNIKILLNEVVSGGNLTEKQRNSLLGEMTDDVADLVLYNNYRQTQAISIAQFQSRQRVGEYRRFINALEASGRLNRALEFLPPDDVLVDRQSQGKSLTRPELSVLVSYAKVQLKEELDVPAITDDAYIASIVETAFPAEVRKRYKEQVYSHRLRSEIIATQLANDMVNIMGINFCQRQMESTGSNPAEVAKAYVAARDIYELDAFWRDIEALDYKVDAQLQLDIMSRMMRRIRRASRWFLRNRRTNLDVATEVKAFRAPLTKLRIALPDMIRGEPRKQWEAESRRLIAAGVPEPVAARAAIPINVAPGLSMVEAAVQSKTDILRVAEIQMAASDFLGLDWFADEISNVKVENYWQSMAREAFLDDLDSQLRCITVSLIRLLEKDQSIEAALAIWADRHKVLVDRWRSMIADLRGATGTDYAIFSVALRELLDLAQASQFSQ
ncbi:NAD-glutamate dehydrogenase [Simiduia sp. 21SJ11W-1]|uniref:NAD-glutamate dehydrogenase n=1 Tax=Simiduia sp. 21SJ11W-1 TaxID=2909669 RepID=UPI0020A19526|nr:NAD-glutamate dehydrogenase [Simiduia sp. 21SJ11W-1]UTA49363.1 NAD-glutamate dehydrogenase [Simiduia sp. 21SJ11W-1]